MPKRKRTSPSPSPDDPHLPRPLSRQKKLCTQILEKKQKALVSALRLGAGFERQKYSRRRKTAKENNDEKAVARLDEEYRVLKGLEIPKIAEQHLRKTIAKVKSLKDHEGLPEEVKEIEKGAKDPALLNVTARLYKVQGVKKVVDECIDELKKALKVDSGKEKEQTKGEEKTKANAREKTDLDNEAAVGDSDGDDEDDIFAAFDARIAAPSSGEEDSDDSLPDDYRPPSVADSEEGDFDIDELGSDDSTTGSEDGIAPRNGDDGVEDESGSSEEESEFEGFSEDDLKPKANTKSKTTPQKVAASTFLPSLSHAAYFSGSESEAEDLDIDIAPKKNRRGQRARQKIWEAKFGEKAKHKQKEERNKGWDPKRGAIGDDPKGKDGRRRGPAKSGRGPERSGDNLIELGPRKKTKRDDTGALHPSWQAAKAAKEKKMMAKPQGTKVVFD
jgi:hypothetical protein